MRKALKITTALSFGIIIILLLNSCKKEGPPGPPGPAGQNGNTKVISATFAMSSWSYASPYHYRNLSVPELTANNVDSAMVMVYFSTTGAEWLALPYTQYNSPYNYYMGFSCTNAQVQVTWFYDSSLSQGSDPNTYYGTTVKCKVVIIPPARKRRHINHMNYEEVKTSYNLAD